MKEILSEMVITTYCFLNRRNRVYTCKAEKTAVLIPQILSAKDF